MNKYAVLVSGGVNASYNYGRYLNDLAEMYKTLVGKYGYAKSDITVLYADGSSHDLDGDGKSEITKSATKADLTKTLQDLKSKLTKEDLFFFFSTNHGGQLAAGSDKARLWLWNQEFMEDAEFATLLDALSYKLAIITMEQCFSGGFLHNLQGPNRVIATACDWNEVSYACDSEGNYDEFVYYWTAAVRDQKPDGTPVSAGGSDGKVSLREAFDYAKANDSTKETPQYYENPEGIGSQYTLGGPIAAVIKPCSTALREMCFVVREHTPCTVSRQFCLATRETPCTASRQFCLATRETPCSASRQFCIARETTCPLRDVITCYGGDIRGGGCLVEGVKPTKPDERVILPEIIRGMYSGMLAGIQSLSNSGYGNENVAAVLEGLAGEMEADLKEILGFLDDLKGGQGSNCSIREASLCLQLRESPCTASRQFCTTQREICTQSRQFCLTPRDIPCAPSRQFCFSHREIPCPMRDAIGCYGGDIPGGCLVEGIKPTKPDETIILPVIINGMYSGMRAASRASIQSLSNSGYSNEDIATALEGLAGEIEAELREILGMLDDLRGGQGNHFKRLTRR